VKQQELEHKGCEGHALYALHELLENVGNVLDHLEEHHGIQRTDFIEAVEEALSIKFKLTDLRIRLSEAIYRVPKCLCHGKCRCPDDMEVSLVRRGCRLEAIAKMSKRLRLSKEAVAKTIHTLYPIL
jgi:hypothetical protein